MRTFMFGWLCRRGFSHLTADVMGMLYIFCDAGFLKGVWFFNVFL